MFKCIIYALALFLWCNDFLNLTRISAVQVPIPSEHSDSSNLIFASLHSLLKSWPQAFAPHGHAVLPAMVKTGTLLYHAGDATEPPTGMEWFAFDAEHSYIFGGGWKGGPLADSKLYTYTASRPLRALYFDGFSAAKTTQGTLDLQDLLVYGKVDDKHRHDDLERGKLLCEWGKQFGIEGFVREEATFELLWCNFKQGVHLVDITNISLSMDVPDSGICHVPDEQCPLLEPLPWGTPYSDQTPWSFYHAASWHHHISDARIILYPAYLVSLYDPVYTSLAANNKLPVRKHRLTDLSPEDLTLFKTELTEALKIWNEHGHCQSGSGIDWLAIAQAVADRNGDRISEMWQVLGNVSTSSNVTEIVAHVRLMAFALVMPYVDAPSVLSSASAPNRARALVSSQKRCTTAFTGHIESSFVQLTAQEHRLKHAIEGVLGKICTLSTSILGDSLTLLEGLHDGSDTTEIEVRQRLAQWQADVSDLMGWLGWAMWQRCPQICAWDEQCYVPMWPLVISVDHPYRTPFPTNPDEEVELLVPRCVNRDWLKQRLF